MDNASVPPRRMPLHLLEEITHDFSKGRNIGAGSYGSVYRGEHKNGETIAVKLLHDIPGLDAEQFENEYHNLASLEHKNVVRLVGYCDETRREVLPFNGKMVFAEMTKRALCFEYMHNGSLEKYLSDEFNGHDWRTCYTIIKGICHELKYLHEELQSPMYHFDLKPANVLLAEHMVAKLADFGMARLYGGEKTQMTKSAIGTHGYVPPEYIDAAIISNKFDIFSFEVLIIKIMTGAKGYYRSAEMSSQEFIEHVHANWTKRLHAESLYLLDSYSEQVKRCIDIALSCLEGDRHKRPTIGLIVNKLNETETMSKMSSEEPDKPLESAVLSRLKQFSAMNELKKMALRVIAETLSEEETAGLKEMFKMMDTDNNGQISYEELKAELEWGGAKMKESEIYQLMKAAHIDNSGTIDYGEFIAATLNLNIVVEREEHLFAAFEYFDKDGSGYITTDELQQACDEFGIKDIRLEDMIGEVDQDNDGCIDYNEFVAMMQKSSPGVGKEGSPQS